MHKANYESHKVITVFAPAGFERGIFSTVGADGQIAAAAAGTMPDVVTMSPTEVNAEAIAGAIPNGGIVLVQAGGPITAGDAVTGDGDGKAVVAAAGNAIVGKALTSADAASEFVAIQFNFRGTAA